MIKMSIVLASGSPRRRELMEMLDVKDLVIIPAKGEEKPPEGEGPGELVMALASAKAREVAAARAARDTVIGADTIVWVDGRVLGKPHSEQEAGQMLRLLSGNVHEVYTGVCLIKDGEESCQFDVTRVRFRPLSEREIAAYIKTGEPMDKAGAYGAQGKAALFVQSIEGDFFNVMGLPLCMLGEMLKQRGVEVL